jgi:propanol-preferring alcohol dehydrogenase
MKAAILRAFKTPLEITDVPVPEPREGEVVVKVQACGVCHSDVHLADGDWDLLRPHTKLPAILGHEIAGSVAAVGPAVDQLKIGDRAGVPWLHWTCGQCEWCRGGDETLCPDQQITGVTVDGGYAEYIRAKASHVARLPDSIPFAEAAPLLCAGLTVHRALKRALLRPGHLLCVFGIGGLGHFAVQLGLAAGARVCAVDVSPAKLELAAQLGAIHCIDGMDPGASRAIRKLGGAHVAIVTSASVAAYQTALRSLRRGGTLAAVGMPADSVPVSMVSLVAGEARITASAVGTRQDLRELLDIAAAGKIRCLSQECRLQEINEVFTELRSGAAAPRIVITWP